MDKEKSYINFDELTSKISHKDFLKSEEPKFWDSKLNRLRLLSLLVLLGAFFSAPNISNSNNVNATLQTEKTKVRQKILFSHLDREYYIEVAPRISIYYPNNTYQIIKYNNRTDINLRINKGDVFKPETTEKIENLINSISQSKTEPSSEQLIELAENFIK